MIIRMFIRMRVRYFVLVNVYDHASKALYTSFSIPKSRFETNVINGGGTDSTELVANYSYGADGIKSPRLPRGSTS
jgi:hypothetical protein